MKKFVEDEKRKHDERIDDNKIVKENKNDNRKALGCGLILVAIIATGVNGAIGEIKLERQKRRFYELLDKRMNHNADYDGNAVISTEEETHYFHDFLRENGLVYREKGRAIVGIDGVVDYPTLTTLLEKYKPIVAEKPR